MTIEIRPGDVIQGETERSRKPVDFRVQAVCPDGRVIISPGRSRTIGVIAMKGALLNGGVVDGGKLGRFKFSLP
ncbi:hypothetical protein HY384_03920 [Candidatus Daviesbacteria bacterium]|nr:hypothetical protein [Candidatus Daviesbacteria bacterium]